MDTLWTTLAVLGSSLATAFGQWVFYFRKHKSDADRSEIENLNLIAKEWREAAKVWKDMVDEYHLKALQNMKRIEELESKVAILERQLNTANKKIEYLNSRQTS
jgi:predicted  nucleic acid-binding Zn-ribbon protein